MAFWKPAATSIEAEGDESALQAPYHRNPHVSIAQQRLLLPIYTHKKQILYAVETYKIVILVGETGSGKSTQIPQYLVESGGWAGNDFSVVCTQPRRIAATSLAQRVAQEVGTAVGRKVGYTVRFDDRSSPQETLIKYVTDGILLREVTMIDPLLSSYSVVMVDEAHERNLNSDAVLGMLKKIRVKRPDLRIIVCSATIDAQAFLDFFLRGADNGKDEGTIISVDGRQYPIDLLHVNDPVPNYLQSTVDTAFQIIKKHADGDILCFLPTAEDVDQAIQMASELFEDKNVQILPLYSRLPRHMLQRVFDVQEGSNRNRRVIFATNVAETSVTVPNVMYVVDSGLVKLPYFDHETGLNRLILGPISQASARQRAGRSGRVRPGKCYRLYTEQYFSSMQKQTTPEILRTDVTPFILNLKALGVDNILCFDLMDAPSYESVSLALETLYALGALDENTDLTDLGMKMAAFPTEPCVSRMLLESLNEKCSWEVVGVASVLQVHDLWVRPRTRQQRIDFEASMMESADISGDHVTYANLLSEVDDLGIDSEICRERFLNQSALKRAQEVRHQLGRFLRRYGRVEALGVIDPELRSKKIRKCLTAGFFMNVAKLHNDGRYYTLRKHILVTASSSSVLSLPTAVSSEYILFHTTVDGPRGGLELRHVSSIQAQWLRELAPHYWK